MNTLKSAIKKVIPYETRKKMRNFLARLKYKRYVTKYIRHIQGKKCDLFKYIEIETINRCNGKCSFCPVNAAEPQRPYAKMTDELYRKIIGELKDLNFDGRISLHSNNEPFLDERIIDLCQYAKEEVPKALIQLYTNGSLLTKEKVEKIINYVDELHIDNYSDAGVVNNNLRAVKEFIESNEKAQKVVIFHMRMQNEVLTSRGGQAPNKKNVQGIMDIACLYPFKQMVIRPDGKCSLCCSDALGKYTLGDVNVKTLKEIWYSDEYTQIRTKMINNRRKGLMLCANCDVYNLV